MDGRKAGALALHYRYRSNLTSLFVSFFLNEPFAYLVSDEESMFTIGDQELFKISTFRWDGFFRSSG